MTVPRITLDQWAALVAVVEEGGYAQASRQLHRTQSTVTYTIQKLEEQLGLKVFERQGRRSVLSPAGQVLYRRGKALLDDATRIERSAAGLAQGWEAEIRLAVDAIFPTWLLLRALGQFGSEHPDIRIEVIEAVLGAVEEALIEGRVDFIIGTQVPGGFIGDALMQVRFVCAAAPSHPLHQLGRAVEFEDLRAHRHLVVRDSSARRGRSGGWLNERRWTVSNKATSIRAARMGLGYAWFAADNVREELDDGSLRQLPLAQGAERFATLYLVHADRVAAGPGTRRLVDILREQVAANCRVAAVAAAQ